MHDKTNYSGFISTSQSYIRMETCVYLSDNIRLPQVYICGKGIVIANFKTTVLPIIKSSDQKSKTLEEFYKELTSENATVVENEIGKAMLDFISMVNETFKNSILFGLTSHYSLVIQATDNWEDGNN
jgi:hypothetical protein